MRRESGQGTQSGVVSQSHWCFVLFVLFYFLLSLDSSFGIHSHKTSGIAHFYLDPLFGFTSMRPQALHTFTLLLWTPHLEFTSMRSQELHMFTLLLGPLIWNSLPWDLRNCTLLLSCFESLIWNSLPWDLRNCILLSLVLLLWTPHLEFTSTRAQALHRLTIF